VQIELPDNATFRAKRANPNLIYPGDVVIIPGLASPSPSPGPPKGTKLDVPYIRQMGSMDCWHAAVRMIFAYNTGVCINPLDSVLKADAGISADRGEIAALAKETGMMSIPISPKSFTAPELEALLRRYGPLWLPLQGKGPVISW